MVFVSLFNLCSSCPCLHVKKHVSRTVKDTIDFVQNNLYISCFLRGLRDPNVDIRDLGLEENVVGVKEPSPEIRCS